MESQVDYWTEKALLEWQIEMGADEAILDAPLDRYALAEIKKAEAPVAPKKSGPPPIPVQVEVDTAAEARIASQSVGSLDDLSEALGQFEHFEIKRGARSYLFAEGRPEARVMIIGDPPRREDDREGRYLSGAIGGFVDKMFGAIGLSRTTPDLLNALYFVPILPWCIPMDRTPNAAECAMALPFLEAHIALAKPEVVVVMGSAASSVLLGQSAVARIRGQWAEIAGVPAMPMYSPERVMSDAMFKREAWADLLAIKARLDR